MAAKFVVNGVEYTGNKIEVKGGVLYVDGHRIADLNKDMDRIEVSGEGGVIHTDKSVIINGFFSGTINAERVVANDSDIIGTVNAKNVTYNK